MFQSQTMTQQNKVMTAGGFLWHSYRFHSQRRRNLSCQCVCRIFRKHAANQLLDWTLYHELLNDSQTNKTMSERGQRYGAQEDILQGHMIADITPQFATESSCLQEVKSATIDQTFAETTDTLTLLRRQEAAEETHRLVSCELLAAHRLCVLLQGQQAQRADSAVFF